MGGEGWGRMRDVKHRSKIKEILRSCDRELAGRSGTASPGLGHSRELTCELREEANNAKITWQHVSCKRNSQHEGCELGAGLAQVKGQTKRPTGLKNIKEEERGVRSSRKDLKNWVRQDSSGYGKEFEFFK